MTDKEKQEWLEVKYPLTIISDRYDGTYSGASWLAFPLYCDEVPPAVDGYDEECAAFWKSYLEPVGKGNSAQTALDDLIRQMREFEPEESEDERIRQSLLAYIKGESKRLDTKKWIAYLEKQKETLHTPESCKENANSFTNEDERVRKALLEMVSDIDGGWPFEKYRLTKKEAIVWLEKQKEQEEQKPAEWSEDFDKEVKSVHKRYPEVSFAKLTRIAHHFAKWADKYKSTEWSEEDEAILKVAIAICNRYSHEDVADWLKSLPLNLKKKNEDVAKLCSNEWSEEAKEAKETIIAALTAANMTTDCKRQAKNWLQSLRPSWKPSEEQMEALRVTLEYMPDTFKPRCTLETLQNDLKKL